MKKYFQSLFLVVALCPTLFAQQPDSLPAKSQEKTEKIKIVTQDYSNSNVEMADTFRADGKIYVVVAVIMVILSGLFVYLFLLDKKIAALEKMKEEKEN